MAKPFYPTSVSFFVSNKPRFHTLHFHSPPLLAHCRLRADVLAGTRATIDSARASPKCCHRPFIHAPQSRRMISLIVLHGNNPLPFPWMSGCIAEGMTLIWKQMTKIGGDGSYSEDANGATSNQ